MFDNTNIAYTQEGLEYKIKNIRSFYTFYEKAHTTEVDLKILFEEKGLYYPEDEDFPYKISLEKWSPKEGKPYFEQSKLIVHYREKNRRGEIKERELDLERNYGSTYLELVEQNNNYYLIFGHDYQGISSVNLNKKTISYYLPKAALRGGGFCIIGINEWLYHDNLLSVEGCYWGGPYVDRVYRIQNLDDISLEDMVYDGYDHYDPYEGEE